MEDLFDLDGAAPANDDVHGGPSHFQQEPMNFSNEALY